MASPPAQSSSSSSSSSCSILTPKATESEDEEEEEEESCGGEVNAHCPRVWPLVFVLVAKPVGSSSARRPQAMGSIQHP